MECVLLLCRNELFHEPMARSFCQVGRTIYCTANWNVGLEFIRSVHFPDELTVLILAETDDERDEYLCVSREELRSRNIFPIVFRTNERWWN